MHARRAVCEEGCMWTYRIIASDLISSYLTYRVVSDLRSYLQRLEALPMAKVEGRLGLHEGVTGGRTLRQAIRQSGT